MRYEIQPARVMVTPRLHALIARARPFGQTDSDCFGVHHLEVLFWYSLDQTRDCASEASHSDPHPQLEGLRVSMVSRCDPI